MKKYMYIDTCEREINEPTFFDKKEKAIYHMVNDFCTVRDIYITQSTLLFSSSL